MQNPQHRDWAAMDIDNQDLDDYLISQDGAAAVAAAFSIQPSLSNTLGPGAVGLSQRSLTNGEMDSIVENARRQSMASGYSTNVNSEFMNMADEAGESSAYSNLVSPASMVSNEPFSMAPTLPVMAMSGVSYSNMNQNTPGRALGTPMMNGPSYGGPMPQVPNPAMFMPTSNSLNVVPITPTTLHSPMSANNIGDMSNNMSNNMQSSMPNNMQNNMQHSMQNNNQQQNSYQSGGMAPEIQAQLLESAMKTETRFEGIYSASGFDMIEILYRVASRPNPQINIGAVDMSCSFVVTDARKFDNPIVYCSATFERLTGYSKHEILGRNCRFLQAPDGDVQPGMKRKYVDNDTIQYMKNQITANKEAQASLINYRKGGQPFMNLLTMIPITWDSAEIAYFVGFQVDLVEQPGSVLNRNSDGSFAINYQYSQLPKYIPVLPQEPRRQSVAVARDDVSHVLSSIANGESELSKRIWDKVLLENTDDVVHVLSLKGLFLYCSPAIRKVLEYEPQELVGTALSSVCHPSDIVPVTRDLKEYSGSSINVVFRIRRKYSGYVWFESHGRLHTEQGKGRKSIILVGRERPVYMLSWKELDSSGGIQENEVWTKLSTSGMFLFVSSNIKQLLDHNAEDLMGTSIQALMRSDSKNDIGKALENARSGKRCIVRHEIQNKRGQFMQCSTHLFPGDGGENQKPTFLVAQTRLLKHSRGASNSPRIQVMPDNINSSSSSDATTPGKSLASSSPNTNSTLPTSNGSPDNHYNQDSTGTGALQVDSSVEDNVFDELKPTRSTSWQYELRQMQRANKKLVEELSGLLAAKKKRKRRRGVDQMEKDCANCHTRSTPEWRRGPSGKRDLCNSCGLRYAKLVGRVSPRTTTNASTSVAGDLSPSLSSPPTNGPSNLSSVAENSPASTVPVTPSNKDFTLISPLGLTDQPPPRKKSITGDGMGMSHLSSSPVFGRLPVAPSEAPRVNLSGG